MFDLYIVLIIAIALIVLHRRKVNKDALTQGGAMRRDTMLQLLFALGFVISLVIALRFGGGSGPMKLVVVLPIAVALFALTFILAKTMVRFRERIVTQVVRILGARHAPRYASFMLALLMALGIVVAVAINRFPNAAPKNPPAGVTIQPEVGRP